MTEMPRAYSYIRFSTPEQQRGDSLRRQTEKAQAYAAAQGLYLDDSLTFEDRGISGFRGANAARGALRKFLDAVELGIISPGSFLLIESLDRVSRQDPWEALPVFQQIINAGVTIVTVQDGRAWSRDELRANPFRIMESLMVMIRANEESVTKSRRVRSARDAARAAVRRGERAVFTTRCPAWLRARSDRSGFEVIEDRAAIVRRVFEMAAEGIGQGKIAATLNAEGTPTWGDSGRRPATQWRRSYIVKLLRTSAVIGTFVPHTIEEEQGRKVRTPQAEVPDYFPRVVSQALFQQVQALRHGAVAPGRGRHAGHPTQNVLGGLAKCGRCGSTMTRVYKGRAAKAGPPYLVCEAAKGGRRDQRSGRPICEYKAIRLASIETALREGIGEAIALTPLPTDDSGLDGLIAGREVELGRLERQAREVADAIAEGGSRSLVQRLRELDDEQEVIRAALEQLRERRAAAQGPFIELRLSALQAVCETDPMDRADVNLKLRAACSAVTVNFDQGTLEFDWSHGVGSSLVYDHQVLVRAAVERASE